MKKSILLSSLVLFLITSLLPGICADNLKIGSGNFKPSAPVVLSVIGDSATVSFAGTRGRNVGTANFIFQKIVNQIVQGAEFDVVTGANGEDGKVLITFTNQSVSGRGAVKLIGSDDDSLATGKIKILSVESNGDFTFSVNAEVTNALQRKSNPLSGNINGTDSRFKGKVRITGKISATKAN